MRRRLARIGLLYLTAGIIALTIFIVSRHRDYELIQRQVQATDDLLDTPVRARDESTLGQAIASIRADTGLRIIVDWGSLASEGVTHDTPIAIACHDDSLATVLRAVLRSAAGPSFVSRRRAYILASAGTPFRPKNLGFYVDNQGRVVIATYAKVKRTVCLYDVSDLAPAMQTGYYTAENQFEQLICGEMVIDAMTYEKVGAWCSDLDSVQMIKSTHLLLVTTTRDGHRRIARLLLRLRHNRAMISRLYFHRGFGVDLDD